MQQAVVGVVHHKGKILVGKKQQKKHAMSEQWHIPGGKVAHEETPKDALRREIKEEADITIQHIQHLAEVFADGYTVHWFSCSAANTTITPGDDLTDARFVDKEQVPSICGKQAISRWPKEVREYFSS